VIDLVRAFEQHPDEAVQTGRIDVLRARRHGSTAALERLAALLDGHGLRDDALADPHVALLYELYQAQDEDEGDDDLRVRAEAAVAGPAPTSRRTVVASRSSLRRTGSSTSGCSAPARPVRGHPLR
jgi:hypothetical protein